MNKPRIHIESPDTSEMSLGKARHVVCPRLKHGNECKKVKRDRVTPGRHECDTPRT